MERGWAPESRQVEPPTLQPYARDDDLLRPFAPGEAPRLRLHRPAATIVVLGRASRPARELDLHACLADGVPIYRRPGGGCAVVLDAGNLVLSLALPIPGLGGIREAYDRITRRLIAGLADLGVSGVRREGACDLALGDRKIGGACVYRRTGLLYYCATILERPGIGAIERYLAHPPREPEYRRGRAHRDFIGAVGPLGAEMEVARAFDSTSPSLPWC